MRKTIVYTLCTAMLCAFLCGCGNQDPGSNDPVIGTPAVPEITPMVSPMPTPDPKDGYVDDRDGIMEDEKTERDSTTNGEMKNGKPSVSPSPEVTSRP